MPESDIIESMRKKTIALAKQLGAVLAVSSDYGMTITVEAPAGKHWKYSGVHELVITKELLSETAAECWQDTFERMSEGLEECDPHNPECQNWRNDEAD